MCSIDPMTVNDKHHRIAGNFGEGNFGEFTVLTAVCQD